MKKVIVDGNEAVARISYLFTELAPIYPITPSSPMAEKVEVMSNNNEKNFFKDSVKIVEMQSEAGAAGVFHGALQSGTYATSFTASQGLLLMIPNMYKIAGEMLPGVLHVASRSLSTHALSILGDHQDIYATRMTGFNMLASSSVEEASDMAAIAHLTAMKTNLPILHFFDGFRTSHEINKIDLLERSDLESLLPSEEIEKFHNNSILEKNYTVGTNQNDDIYFQVTESRNIFYEKVPDIINDYMEKINKIKKTNYKPFEYYGSSVATEIIIAMGSITETIKETIDDLNDKGYNVGLITVHLYRPFSEKYLKQVIPETVKKIAVLDRTKENGSVGEPLYLDVKSVLSNYCVYGGRYGLSSKNTNPACIKAIYDFLKKKPTHNFTVGIIDDVTHKSLNIDNNYKLKNSTEIKIYGYGSDGSVSTSKSLVKIIGENTDSYVQAYSSYDSKKSGGVTVSNIRISNDKIRSTYYVENSDFTIITKDSYLLDFDCFKDLNDNAKVLINTNYSKEELIKLLKKEDLDLLKQKKATVYIINAYLLARKLGLKNKISMIMESAIFKLLDYDSNKCRKELIKYIETKFIKKGKDIIKANIDAINEVDNYIEKLSLDKYDNSEILTIDTPDLLDQIESRNGNMLSTKDVLSISNGRFSVNKRKNKRAISDIVPRWISSNCINCNQCSFVCPHGVIRPFILSKEEYDKAPQYIKNRVVKPTNPKLQDYYYLIAISINNCTGCGLCIKTCPSVKKALIDSKLIDEIKNKEMDIFNYAVKNISEKDIVNKYTIQGSQLRKPQFEFCGACSGCGETAYIRILTQLLQDQLIISNATGCSSIYGASIPTLPYSISFASSLFEDNAEYGYGIMLSSVLKRKKLYPIMEKYKNDFEVIKHWLEHPNDVNITKEVYEELKDKNLPDELKNNLENIKAKSIWCVGGDGWAYDIGYGGIDHILSTNDNINILVLDTEVYSNTGGQSSKASTIGSVASFTSLGKKVAKKDLASIAMMYPNCYVAQISLGANMMQVLKVMKEAIEYNGPSIIIAYTPCISHGIKGGMQNSIEMEKLAVECGYFPIFHRNPETGKFILDYKNVDFDKYGEFLERQARFNILNVVNKKDADNLLNANKEEAKKRFNYYQSLEK